MQLLNLIFIFLNTVNNSCKYLRIFSKVLIIKIKKLYEEAICVDKIIFFYQSILKQFHKIIIF